MSIPRPPSSRDNPASLPPKNLVYLVLGLLIVIITGLLLTALYLPQIAGQGALHEDFSEDSPALRKFGPADSIVDARGNRYPTVRIGQQIWMAENLRLIQAPCRDSLGFADGRETFEAGFYDSYPRYGYYHNDSTIHDGALYNFPAIESCDLCPAGFRVPTKADWLMLIDQLGGFSQAGHWLLQRGEASFGGQLAGRLDAYGSVLNGRRAYWWSSEYEPRVNGPKVYVLEVWKGGEVLRLTPQSVKVYNSIRCVQAALAL